MNRRNKPYRPRVFMCGICKKTKPPEQYPNLDKALCQSVCRSCMKGFTEASSEIHKGNYDAG